MAVVVAMGRNGRDAGRHHSTATAASRRPAQPNDVRCSKLREGHVEAASRHTGLVGQVVGQLAGRNIHMGRYPAELRAKPGQPH